MIFLVRKVVFYHDLSYNCKAIMFDMCWISKRGINLMSEQNKTNKTQIVGIVVGAIVTLAAAFIGVFNNEIRKTVYDFLYDDEIVEPVHYNTFYLSDDIEPSEQGLSQLNPTVDKNSDTETQPSKASESITIQGTELTTERPTESHIIKPRIYLGNEVNSIEFLQIESNNVFIDKNPSIKVESFNGEFERTYKEYGSTDDNMRVAYITNGYGLYCTLPLKQNGDLHFNGVICDSSKIPLDMDTAFDTFKQKPFLGIDDSEQLILAFSLGAPLKKGIYYFKFDVIDYINENQDDIYIKFKIT